MVEASRHGGGAWSRSDRADGQFSRCDPQLGLNCRDIIGFFDELDDFLDGKFGCGRYDEDVLTVARRFGDCLFQDEICAVEFELEGFLVGCRNTNTVKIVVQDRARFR